MRLFVALDLPDDVRRAIGELLENLRRSIHGPSYVRADAMHITLKFIGEVAEEKVAGIIRALQSLPKFHPFELSFGILGYFPNEKRPSVLWAGITAPPALAELASAIERALEPLGVARESRDFHPHLTLARLKSPAGVPQVRDAVKKLQEIQFGAAQFKEFHLYQSTLKPTGAEYARMATFSLVEAGQ
ncbi:MAG: RNA 2',3'-cyclic phosphodiesterase [Acidobacteria bacterium]|nr:RNA 2',3'-cyclic phosphodiesterase [Acidobacteriota bacterium]